MDFLSNLKILITNASKFWHRGGKGGIIFPSSVFALNQHHIQLLYVLWAPAFKFMSLMSLIKYKLSEIKIKLNFKKTQEEQETWSLSLHPLVAGLCVIIQPECLQRDKSSRCMRFGDFLFFVEALTESAAKVGFRSTRRWQHKQKWSFMLLYTSPEAATTLLSCVNVVVLSYFTLCVTTAEYYNMISDLKCCASVS